MDLTADSGSIHLGFDPPLPSEGDPDDEYWASVVQGGTNTIVNVEFPNNTIGERFEWVMSPSDQSHVTITQGTLNEGKANLELTGLGSGGIYDATIELKSKGTNYKVLTLKVKVLPSRTITIGVYTLEDSTSPSTQFNNSPIVSVPNVSETISTLNDTFSQAGINFVAHTASGEKFYEFDKTGITENEFDQPIFDENLPDRAPDGKLSRDEMRAIDNTPGSTLSSLFPGEFKVFFVKNSGIPYDNNPSFNIRGSSVGAVFVNESLGYSVLVVAHEIGHQLGLSSDNEDGGHDIGPFPPGVVGDNPNNLAPIHPGPPHRNDPNWALMDKGEPTSTIGSAFLPWIHGRWMKREDWNLANENAE